jgi:hypothetical protein
MAVRRVEPEGRSVLRGARIEASRARRDGGGDGRLVSIRVVKGGTKPGERSWLRIRVSCWVKGGNGEGLEEGVWGD